jgi:outer membrane immunogenic protein
VTANKYRGVVTATGAVFDSADDQRWGAVVGTGLEFGFAPNWSVGVEYNHLFMDRSNVTLISQGVLGGIPAGSVFRNDSIRNDVDMVTARINYRFGPSGLGRY